MPSDRSIGPFGQDEPYGSRAVGHNGLIHELRWAGGRIVHETWDGVDGMSTTLWTGELWDEEHDSLSAEPHARQSL